MLDTTELSIRPGFSAAMPDSSSSMRTTTLDSPADSEGTEFFDAHEAMPWTPEPPTRQSPATIAARRMQLALWPEPELEEGVLGAGFGINGANSQPPPADLHTHQPKAAIVTRASSLRSLFPSKAPMLQPQGWKVIDSNTYASGGGGADADHSRRSAESSTQSYSRSDSLGDVDDSSTASGTTGTAEDGWDNGHGSDVDVEEPSGVGEGIGGGERSTAAVTAAAAAAAATAAAPSKGRSLRRRVLGSARILNKQRERRASKTTSIGRRRGSHTAAGAAADGVTPSLDPGATSPDGIPAPAKDATAEVGELPADKHDSRSRSKSHPCKRTCSYRLRRGGKGRPKSDRRTANRPPEVHVKQHGRGGGKGKDWQSMHMLQCLRYHEGPVWTMKFNVRGTRLATGGQDGKVVIWDLAVPPGSAAAATTEVVRDGSEGASPPMEGDGVDANTNGGADAQESSSSGVETSSTVEGEGSRETLRKTESMSCASTILSDDGAASVGDGSSDLGLSGSSEERGDSWSGSEVFAPTPVRVFEGHKSDIVDLSWSHSDFLCSASIDHTVMLWHPIREERLGTFTHPDFVTSVHFHPLDDHIFLTGCFDKRLRLWKIPDGRVVDWVQCQDMVSAASFSPDGKLAAAGLYNGRVMFYHTTDLRYYTQIHCRNRHGSKRRGKKVTGLDFIETSRLHPCGDAAAGSVAAGNQAGGAGCPVAAAVAAGGGDGAAENRQQQQQHLRGGKADSMSSQYSLLTTTNDSRLRVYDLDNFAMTSKFKGLVNDGIQIKASFSTDGMFVVSGSEDGQVYLWNSKQRRQRTARSVPSCNGGGGHAAAGGVAAAVPGPPPACSASITVATATTPATLVKSRTSSSFDVQCATLPQVATAAAFLPTAALEAARLAGGVERDDSAAGVKRGTKGWRGGVHHSPPMPAAAHATGDAQEGGDGGGGHHTSRRRWSFTGHARSVAAGAGAGAHPKTLPQATTGGGKAESAAMLPHVSEPWINKNGSPRAVNASEPSMALGSEIAAQQHVGSPGATRTTPGQSSGRFPGGEGMVKAVVSADFNGEIKIFLGVVGRLEGCG
ncbi:unnamed protein product [Ectocarpus sp. 6 AP-2014]